MTLAFNEFEILIKKLIKESLGTADISDLYTISDIYNDLENQMYFNKEDKENYDKDLGYLIYKNKDDDKYSGINQEETEQDNNLETDKEIPEDDSFMNNSDKPQIKDITKKYKEMKKIINLPKNTTPKKYNSF